ncbi:MAG TPA: SEC-C metal-binding domain-containing protein [Chlamydiales bacterium]|jgi:hypothetical protein
MQKTGRNDPCPCGSGKKFKKCCESKMLGGKFMATKVDAAAKIIPSRLTNLFQARVSENQRPADLPVKPITPMPSSPAISEETDGKH